MTLENIIFSFLIIVFIITASIIHYIQNKNEIISKTATRSNVKYSIEEYEKYKNDGKVFNDKPIAFSLENINSKLSYPDYYNKVVKDGSGNLKNFL